MPEPPIDIASRRDPGRPATTPRPAHERVALAILQLYFLLAETRRLFSTAAEATDPAASPLASVDDQTYRDLANTLAVTTAQVSVLIEQAEPETGERAVRNILALADAALPGLLRR